MDGREEKKTRRWPWAAKLLCLGVIGWALLEVFSPIHIGDLLRDWTETESIGGVSVLRRKCWNAAAVQGKPDMLKSPLRITVHHLGGRVVGEFGREANARIIKAIQRDHQGRRSWNDIAYHYVIDRAGRIWEGRPLSQTGAHAGSAEANEGNIGVLVIGNFDLQVLSGAQSASLRSILDALCQTQRLPRSSVCGHNEVRESSGLGHTECPGKHLIGWLEDLRKT